MRMQNRMRRQNGYVEYSEKGYVLLGRDSGGIHGFRGCILEYRIDHLFH